MIQCHPATLLSHSVAPGEIFGVLGPFMLTGGSEHDQGHAGEGKSGRELERNDVCQT